MVGQARLAGSLETEQAGAADLRSAAGVFVVGGDVADAGVQPDSVVAVADGGQLAVEVAGVGELAEIGPFVLEVPKKLSIGAWSVGTPGRP